jgi:uncharacterized protein YraI
MTLSGTPVLVRVDKSIDFDWGTGSPSAGVFADNFSVRWTGTLNVSPGRYRFIMATDDGGRLWVNGQLVINKWLDQQGGFHEVTVDLPNGSAAIQMEYFENLGGAKALMTYVRQDGGSSNSGGPWKGEYFNNKTLSGQPALARNEADINFNWGAGSPAPGVINSDSFSARWTQNLDLSSGRYQFAVTVDDGVRLWVNNQLIIDQWRDQQPTTYRGEINLAGGSVPVKMEYYDNTGDAKAQLSWALVSGGGSTPGSVPVPGPWRAEYFNNTGLSGAPVLVRDEGQPNNLSGGLVPVRMEYYEADVLAEARLSWQRLSAAANTGSAPMASVTSSFLNVRQGPGVNSAIISRLSRGQIVQLAGIRNADATWVKVILPDGRQGWSYAGFLQSSVPFAIFMVEGVQPAPIGSSMATVANAGYVNVRTGPGATNSIITAVPSGTNVELLGRNGASSWAKIRLTSGTVGWMNAYYLRSITPIGSLSIVN